MSESYYPEDEFDQPDPELRQPVGVHRERPPAWRSWAPLIAVIVIVPLLAWGAVSLLGATSGRSGSTEAASAAATGEATQAAQADAAATEAAAPATQEAAPSPSTSTADADLTTGITVINGTTTQGLAARTGDRLTNVGYTGVAVQGGIYEQSSPATTTLYYAAPENEATARAVAQTLGIANVVESADFAQSNPLVLVLRSDFTE